MKTLIIIASLIGLSACATHPVPVSDAQPVPAARIYAHGEQTAAQNAAVRVTRDAGFSDSALCQVQIAVDGVKAASFEPGETLLLWVAPGLHILSADNSAMCGNGPIEARVTANPDRVMTMRIAFQSRGGMRLMPTAY